MLFNFLKPKKNEIALKREKHEASLRSVTETYNGVKINETLMTRVKCSRMADIDCYLKETDVSKYSVKTTAPRPNTFENNLFSWIESVKAEAKLAKIRNAEKEKEERENYEKLKSKKQQEALEQRREFYINYGLLPKVKMSA